MGASWLSSGGACWFSLTGSSASFFLSDAFRDELRTFPSEVAANKDLNAVTEPHRDLAAMQWASIRVWTFAV